MLNTSNSTFFENMPDVILQNVISPFLSDRDFVTTLQLNSSTQKLLKRWEAIKARILRDNPSLETFLHQLNMDKNLIENIDNYLGFYWFCKAFLVVSSSHAVDQQAYISLLNHWTTLLRWNTEFSIIQKITTEYDIETYSPLLFIILKGNTSILDEMIASGFNPLATDNLGRNLAHYAALMGNAEMLRNCEKHGLDLHAVDEYGRTAAFYCVFSRNPEMLPLAKNLGFKLDVVDNFNMSILHACALTGDQRIFLEAQKLEILDEDTAYIPDADGRYMGHYCALGGNIEILSNAILEDLIDPNLPDSCGRQLLHYCALGGRTETLQVLQQFKDAYNLDFNSQDYFGRSAVFYGALSGNPEMLDAIIKLLEIDLSNPESHPLTREILKGCALSGNPAMLDKAQALEINLNRTDENGFHVIFACALSGKPEMLDKAKKMDLNLKAEDNQGKRLAHYCGISGKKSMLDKAKELGFDVRTEDLKGRTACDYYSRYCNHYSSSDLLSVDNIDQEIIACF